MSFPIKKKTKKKTKKNLMGIQKQLTIYQLHCY